MSRSLRQGRDMCNPTCLVRLNVVHQRLFHGLRTSALSRPVAHCGLCSSSQGLATALMGAKLKPYTESQKSIFSCLHPAAVLQAA